MCVFWLQNRVDIAWYLDPEWSGLHQGDILNVSLDFSQAVHVRAMTCTSLLDCRTFGPTFFVRPIGNLMVQ